MGLNRPAKAAISLSLLGLAAVAALLCWPRSQSEGPQRPKAPAVVTSSEVSGGRTLLLETFSPEGRRRWRLELASATVTVDRVLEGHGVAARYFGTAPPTILVAERIAYHPGQGQLVFEGGIRLTGPLLTLTAPRLIWDDRSRSFTIGGGYVLTRAGTTLRGERLWADESFREIRALGAVRLRTTSIGGGTE